MKYSTIEIFNHKMKVPSSISNIEDEIISILTYVKLIGYDYKMNKYVKWPNKTIEINVGISYFYIYILGFKINVFSNKIKSVYIRKELRQIVEISKGDSDKAIMEIIKVFKNLVIKRFK